MILNFIIHYLIGFCIGKIILHHIRKTNLRKYEKDN
jgi:hypothetical protein